MELTADILAFDKSRTRPGMRTLAHSLVMRMGNPSNIHLWHSRPSSDPERVTMSEILGSLGSQRSLWQSSDLDAASRISHMTLMALHAVHSEQYLDKDILSLCMDTQAAAEKVKIRIAEKQARKKAKTTGFAALP